MELLGHFECPAPGRRRLVLALGPRADVARTPITRAARAEKREMGKVN